MRCEISGFFLCTTCYDIKLVMDHFPCAHSFLAPTLHGKGSQIHFKLCILEKSFKLVENAFSVAIYIMHAVMVFDSTVCGRVVNGGFPFVV